MESVLNLDTLEIKRAVIEVMGACNYSCEMCPQSTPGRDASFLKRMPFELFENILDQLTPRYGKPLINLEGSGEPTTLKDLPRYIEACTKRGLESMICCNGSQFTKTMMQDSLDAGLGRIRFSVIGYNQALYKKWMSKDNWDLILNNVSRTIEKTLTQKKKCIVESYHLILDPSQVAYEVEQYQKNFVNVVGTQAYIWKMHNWSGNYNNQQKRSGVKRTCGRPHSEEITIRAGGIGGKLGAVTPCCQTLGPPNESKSVLGHFSNQSFEEIWQGELYSNLRDKHSRGQFDDLEYCKNCDFLYEQEEVLIWSNNEGVKQGVPLGTSLEFNS